jgi:hypothetical protein
MIRNKSYTECESLFFTKQIGIINIHSVWYVTFALDGYCLR